MTISRYIEINSSYRDRTRFPNPSQFNIELSLSGQNSAVDAKDPIYHSVVKYPPSNTEKTYSTYGYMYGIPISGSTSTNPYKYGLIPIIRNNMLTLEQIQLETDNAYIGDTLELVEYKNSGNVVTHEFRNIVNYRISTYDSEISGIVQTIVTPSFNSIPTDLQCEFNHILIGWTLEFTDTTDPKLLGQKYTITGYNACAKILYFEPSIMSSEINQDDIFVIRIPIYEIEVDRPFSVSIPILSENLKSTTYTTYRIRSQSSTPLTIGIFESGTNNQFTLPSTVGNLNYTNQLLWITSDPIIYTGGLVSYISDTFTITSVSQSLLNMTLAFETGGIKYSFVITEWDNITKTGKINGLFVSGITNVVISQPSPSNYYKIQTYNPSTFSGMVFPSFSYETISEKFNYTIGDTDTFEILQFKTDNYHPLNFAESMVHQQQVHCYEIQLISLTIPNVPLKSGTGKRIAFYPYVYIEFKSITQGTNAYNFNSNNPVIQKNIMFKAPMIYNFNPIKANFITLDGHGMVQQLKFKPNDSFSFAVYLPNGDLFITEQDYQSPSEPNPLLQISACFKVTRLS